MASPSSPTHGKLGAIFRLRPNGFEGDGLNDVTWGAAYSGAGTSGYFEVVIDYLNRIATATLGAGGTGYTVNDVLTIVQTGGSGGTVTVTSVATGVITGISLTTPGSGYAVANGLPVTGGTGSDATINITVIADSFKWRKDGGAYTENVIITGAAQTLSDSQTITFAATTGHTLADSWSIGNLDTEATTEVAAAAQITAATHRLLNPNATITWTDSGSKTVLITEHTIGKATFTGNVTVVTVSGNNGFVLEAALEKVGYLIDWNLNITLDTAEISRMGQHWKEFIPGQAGATGGANVYFIGSESFFDAFKDAADGNQKYFLLQLFNYDPDQDQTGDHFMAWVTFTTFTVNAAVGDAVKESIGFQVFGTPSFTAQD